MKEKAFMGVSIRHPFYFKKENIIKAINLVEDFNEFLIFVVDYPYRFSLQAFNNLDKYKAEKIVLKESLDMRNFLIKICKKYKKIKIYSWKELENNDYKRFLFKIKKLENNNNKFSRLIKNEFTDTIISKIKQNKEKENLSKNMIIEEVAMFCSLVLRGHTTRISKYPRSKSIDYFLNLNNLKINHLQIK